ncbi:MAG: acetoacetate--CoA ligase [Steroidobacteraceae bacterium]
MNAANELAWSPSPERIERARITAFAYWLNRRGQGPYVNYEDLWRWSTNHPAQFWGAAWEFLGLAVRKPYSAVMSSDPMPATRWFVGAELNFVDQVLMHRDLPGAALIYDSETSGQGEVSWGDLERRVASLASALKALGVVRCDRVVAYLPNVQEAVIGFLATASLGAIWSICAPDLGPVSVVDRFRQVGPKVIIACDGYRYGGRAYGRREALEGILGQLPSLKGIVWVPLLDALSDPPRVADTLGQVRWDDAVASRCPLQTEAVAADHPLWILYSSGTSGLPKAIVHGHGGIIANGAVTQAFHSDLGKRDRVLWTSSTSWMVWNAHVCCLLVGATLVLFDGAPTGTGPEPDWMTLWRLAERHRVSFFGGGAAYHHACMKAGLEPGSCLDLSALQTIGSTGSPLSTDGYRWLLERVKSDAWINCVSGGTDICGAFLGGVPTLSVYYGEMQCRLLGAAVYSFSDAGTSITGEVGELVCTKPLPSMPLYFWGDKNNARYLESYFQEFKLGDGSPVWRHGDWLKLLVHDRAIGGVIYGRSDATINRQGIRMGTAELYRAVETLDEITDSLAVDLEYLGRDSWMALFIVLRHGHKLDDGLKDRLRSAIRVALSPRHVPDEIFAAPQVPKTLTGKKLEVPIKKLLLGQPIEKVITRDALANPSSLDWYVEFAKSRFGSAAGRPENMEDPRPDTQ